MNKDYMTRHKNNHSVLKWLFMLSIIFVCGLFVQTNAQTRITGTVSDEMGVAPGATVTVKGTQVAVMTDNDGNYAINVPEGATTLEFSFIGTKTQEVAINGRTEINVTMSVDDGIALGPVEVVSDGFRKIDRRIFVGSGDRLSGEESKIDGMSDASKSLQGKIPGVTMTSVSGTFGAAPKLSVRGSVSIYGSTAPLWVVDGVILEDLVQISADELSSGDPATLISSAIAGLSADDIEDIQFLKDASATALYGARAMNGVIVVTTKRGKEGTVSVNYRGEFTTRLVPSYNDYNIMNSQEQMRVYQELQAKGWLNYADVAQQSNSGLFGYMYMLQDTYDPVTGTFMLENTDRASAQYLQQAERLNTNWFKELFRMSIMQSHSVNMSSGSERSQNYASLSFLSDPGWSVADKVQRFTGNLNSTTKLSEKVSATFTLNSSFRNQQLPGSKNAVLDQASGEISREFDINPFSYALNTSRTLNPDYFYQMNYAPFNEKYELQNNYLTLKNTDVRFQIDLSYKPIAELEISALGSFRYVTSKTEHKISERSNHANAFRAAGTSTIAQRNGYLYVDPENPIALPVTVLPEGGMYDVQEFDIYSYYTRLTANYNKTFNDSHITSFLLGGEVRLADRTTTFANGYGYQWTLGGTPFTDPRIIEMFLNGNANYFGYTETKERAAAFFATAAYSLKGIYTANLSGRMDGTNQLGMHAKDRWLPTWTAGLGWRAGDEKFMEKIKNTVSALAFRATYGMNAKPVPPSANALLILMNDVSLRPSTEEKESMIYISSNQNDELTWEKQREINLGFDLSLWRRVNLVFDIYKRWGYDILSYVLTNGVGGEYMKLANNANINSQGFEFSLGGRAVDIQDGFKYDPNFTFSYNRNTVTKLNQDPRIVSLITRGGNFIEGYAGPALFSYQFTGLDENGFPKFINEEGIETATEIFPQATSGYEHLKYEGPVNAPVQGGFNNMFTYKNWKMSVFFTYQFGGVLRLDPFFKSSYSDLDVMIREMKNRWVLPGDEKVTNVPVIVERGQSYSLSSLSLTYNIYNLSSARVAKSDFIRLKEIYVTYDFPAAIAQKLTINNIQLKLTASNLFLLYADKRLNGQDPEFMNSGGVSMPNPRQFTLSLMIGL